MGFFQVCRALNKYILIKLPVLKPSLFFTQDCIPNDFSVNLPDETL
jgi:hypothetical protein